MKYLDLKKSLSTNIFTLLDIKKHFPQENPQFIKTQVSRFIKRGLVVSIKRGLYCFSPTKIDEMVLANKLYYPSYISLETALNYYGLIPDVPQGITSLNLTTSKTIKNQFGSFYYQKIRQKLFFGFSQVKSPDSSYYFQIAHREKALLDFFYIRKVNKLSGLRLDKKLINIKKYRHLCSYFPRWIKEIKVL